MGYRTNRGPFQPYRSNGYVPPPRCRNCSLPGMPVKMRFVGHRGPQRFFACPFCGVQVRRTV